MGDITNCDINITNCDIRSQAMNVAAFSGIYREVCVFHRRSGRAMGKSKGPQMVAAGLWVVK
jgi:hypothetical protein